MNDLVAAAFELVENFGQREDGAGVNVVQQQDALAARLDTADRASRNLAIVDAGPVVRQEIGAPSHIAMGCEVLLDRLLAQQTTMDGIDLAWEVKLRWPLLPMVLTSGHPRERERVRELPLGVAYLPKPWQPLNVLIAAEQALASTDIRGRPSNCSVSNLLPQRWQPERL